MLGGESKNFSMHSNVVGEQADIREDEEQLVKFGEIVDLLVAAGYFRARIKGLSNFDKVVGGMTWCIESCNFDVDVDLLFHENLTIGQKISLTEKIVAMLPIMNCPHRLEPHQIQGLDCIHIFPVIRWLVKRSMETRKETAGFVRSYALYQYEKAHPSCLNQESDSLEKNDSIETNIQAVNRAYGPRRKYKKLDSTTTDEITRIKSTILEYGIVQAPTTSSAESERDHSVNHSTEGTSEAVAGAGVVTAENKTHQMQHDEERLSASTVGNIVGLQAQEIVQVSERYANLSIDTEDITNESRILVALGKQKVSLKNRERKLKENRDALIKSMDEATEKLKQIQESEKAIEEELKQMAEMETDENREIIKKLEELLAVHAGLKDQSHKFREQCKADANYFQKMVENIESSEPYEEQNRTAEYDTLKESINKKRLLLAKKNRAIATLMRQLDDVPGRSELTQYQLRFMELYNQVAAKHKETKQYYTLYNTLDDTKLYLSKELSLLNSIQDNYKEAMASASGKEQFLKQFEAIIEGVKRNKEKVAKKCEEEKDRRYNYSKKLAALVEIQRKYVAAVKQLTIECRKNEALLAQLRAT
ncbi:hypothetical protein PV327_003746 [Microctonus hyperodae]|uniref:Coiled-coil domain-containing protein 93 n=1 Tax=Microctonus hyperodae TaxID=165561 RepID=A0AA39G5I3_MICHY|nr:hypothetical protein PV327_003746 [Microctonus hyperodae]